MELGSIFFITSSSVTFFFKKIKISDVDFDRLIYEPGEDVNIAIKFMNSLFCTKNKKENRFVRSVEADVNADSFILY